MKILQINKFFYQRGGTETYFFGLMELLKKNGHDVVVFAMKDEKNSPTPYENFFIKNIDFSKREGWLRDLQKAAHFLYSLEAKKKLEKLILTEKPDIAHIHNFSHHLTSSVLDVFKKHHIPVVVTLHDFSLICPTSLLFDGKDIFEKCRPHRYFQCVVHKSVQGSYVASTLAAAEAYVSFLRRVYERKIDACIAPSRFVAHTYQEWGFRNHIRHIPNFVDAKPNQGSAQVIGNEVLFVGRLAREKGVYTLMKAAKLVPEIPFIVVGTGPEEHNLRSIASQNVKFTGSLGHHHVMEQMKRCRFLVFPSEVYENNPLSILEAQAHARVVIGSNLGGIPELVVEGETGFLFEPKNAEHLAHKIRKLFHDEKTLKMMQEAASVYGAKHTDAQTHYERIMDVYRSLVTEATEKSRQHALKHHPRSKPTESKEDRYQSGEYRAKNPTWHEEDAEWKAEQIFAILENSNFLDHHSNQAIKILDIGCGTGGVLGNLKTKLRNAASQLHVQSKGIDVAPFAVNKAKERWSDINFSTQPLETLNEKYDIALLIDVLEHAPDPSGLIAEASKRSSYLLFHIPLDHNWNNRLRKKFDHLKASVGHIHYFDPDACFALMAQHNLEILDYGYTAVFSVGQENAPWLGRLARFPRALGFVLSPSWTAKTLGGLSLLVLVKTKENTEKTPGGATLTNATNLPTVS